MKETKRAVKKGLAVVLCLILGVFTLFPASAYAAEEGPVIMAETIDVGHLIVDAGNDAKIVRGEKVTIGGSPSIRGQHEDAVFEWTSIPASDCSGFGERKEVTPQVTTIYTLTVKDHLKNDGVTYQHIVSDSITVTVVDPVVKLGISKTVDGKETTNAYVGKTVMFAIIVSNSGNTASKAVIVEDTLPSGLEITDVCSGTFDETSRKWTWQISSIAAGASKTAYIYAKVTSCDVKEITNTAYLLGEDLECPISDCAVVVPQQCTPLIVIEKDVDDSYVLVNDTVSYTIAVENRGTAAAEGVVVTDILPAGLEFKGFGSESPANASYDAATGTLTWNIGTLGIERKTLSFDVAAKEDGEFINEASVTWTGKDGSVSDDAYFYAAEGPDLVIVKDVDKPNVTVGENVEFTIRAAYQGAELPARLMAIAEGEQEPDILLVDRLPDGLQYISHVSDGNYNPVTGEWDISDLQYGYGEDGMALKIIAKVTKAGTITNIATATINNENIYDENPENNSDTADVTVNPAPETPTPGTPTIIYYPDYTVVKTADKGNVKVGDNITYTLTARNIGSSASTDVKVTDILPSGLEYVSDSSAGAYNRTTGIWNIGFMNISQEASMTITCRVTASGSITNIASITGPVDSNMTNNTSSATIVSEANTEEIPDEPIPGGGTELPKTGGVPAELFYGTGSALLIAGIGFRKKRH